MEERWRDDLKRIAEDLEGFVTPRLSGPPSKISGLGPSWPKDDVKVGHAMKYVMAWRALDREALEESRFFSVAHLLEATNEIESSVVLAQGSFYKQAKQQLRSLLELVVMPFHFCTNRDSFREWREGEYRTPQFRGPRGLLKQLVARSLLSEQTANEIGDLYGRLSGSIHNEEKELAFSGVLVTSAGRGFPNRPVNCSPLSVSISDGIPYSAIAAVNARQTARAVARMTTVAMTQNLDWSSIPVMTSHSRPSARNRLAVTSICHSSIAADRSQRRYWSRRLRRDTGSIRWWRTSTR